MVTARRMAFQFSRLKENDSCCNFECVFWSRCTSDQIHIFRLHHISRKREQRNTDIWDVSFVTKDILSIKKEGQETLLCNVRQVTLFNLSRKIWNTCLKGSPLSKGKMSCTRGRTSSESHSSSFSELEVAGFSVVTGSLIDNMSWIMKHRIRSSAVDRKMPT